MHSSKYATSSRIIMITTSAYIKGRSDYLILGSVIVLELSLDELIIDSGPSYAISLSYEDDLRRTIDRVTAEIQEIFQQLQNLAQICAFLRPKVILSMDELNLDQAPQDKEEFQLERVHLPAFVGATDPGCKKNSLGPALSGFIKIYY
ncbi:uncharacterized protein TNCV_2982521 [Trichonephila clavipes]|nr:uncharacterized protein TNCV_2982521 [Trichonephila clavipes]